MTPICTNCGHDAEEVWMVYNKFWYCKTCKSEVEDLFDQQDEDPISLEDILQATQTYIVKP